MGQLCNIFVLALFATSPNIVFGNPAIIIAEGLVVAIDLIASGFELYNRITTVTNGSAEGYSKILELLSNPIISSSEEVDRKLNEVFAKLNDLPTDVVYLLDKESLMMSNKTIQEYSAKSIVAQMRMNRNEPLQAYDAKDVLSKLNNAHEQIRFLISRKEFFQRLLPSSKSHYDKDENEGPCYTKMSDAQAIYLLIGRYFSITTQYFMSKIINMNIQNYQKRLKGELFIHDMEYQSVYSELQTYLNLDLKYFRDVLNEVSHDFWTCDQEDEDWDISSFAELKLLTKYVTAKINLLDNVRKDDFQQYYDELNVHGCKFLSLEIDRGLCADTRDCPNKLFDCKMLEEAPYVCLEPDKTYKRYQNVTKKPIEESQCPTGRIAGNDPDAKYFRPDLTKYFECTCVEDRNLWVNTHPVVADAGHIVIGARLVLIDNTLTIQIVQGRISKGGSIDDQSYFGPPTDKGKRYESRAVIKYDDYVDLSFQTVRGDHVITGIRLNKYNDGRRIFLELQQQKVDFLYEQPLRQPRQWLSTIEFARKEHTFEGTDDRPDKSKKHNQHVEGKFMRFGTTGTFGRDAGQTTLPFIDQQFVRPVPYTPLSGMGLYLREQPGYGAYLGIKLETFDATPYLKSNLSRYRDVKQFRQKLETL